MEEFVVAVSRLDFETYIPVAYEGMAITLKPSNISLCRLPPYLETEYAHRDEATLRHN
jgi:hypothetical protein